MNNRLCHHFLKFTRSDVAWHRRRFLSSSAATAAARDHPVSRGKSRKRVPKAERKLMVLDYVNKYRMENAGKFPGTDDTMNQVGGNYYTIRAILQELKHNSDLSAVVTANSRSVKEPAVQRNNVFAVTETSDSVTPLHKIVEPENCGDLSENGINCLGKTDKVGSKQILTRSKDTSLEDVCVNQMTGYSGLESPVDRTRDSLVDTRHLESKKVLKESAEKTSPEMILMDSATEDFKLCEKSGLPSEASGTSCSVVFEREKASAEAPESTMTTVPNPANVKSQDDESMLPAVDIIRETSVMGQTVEADEISEAREALDHRVTMDRTTVADSGSVSDETGLTSHKKLKISQSQMHLDTSGFTKFRLTTEEVSERDTNADVMFERTATVGVDKPRSRRVFDKPNLVKNSADESVKVLETENSQFCENKPYSSGVVGGDSDTRSGDAITTSTPASITGGDSRKTATQKTDEKEVQGTLWGNLKSMASRFIDIWRKT